MKKLFALMAALALNVVSVSADIVDPTRQVVSHLPLILAGIALVVIIAVLILKKK